MTDQPTSTTRAQQRVIRVFVSSTFRDMHAEREELVKRTFPQLRKLCESRGVTWGEVDLRWGIPDEQKAEGKVLPICLAEIQRCRPYFIGLLGERYGWVPDEIPPELIEQEPWLKEHLEHSVTELEIVHGVLRNPQMADHAFFYLRDPSYVDSLRPEQQREFREAPTPEEIERYGQEEAERRAEERKRKLAALKERIRASGLPVRENYRDPQELGQLVLRDLTEVIDRLYPEGSQPDPLDREAAEHEAFARSRAVVEVRPGQTAGVYIGRPQYFDHLDAHAKSDGPPLVVLGESGSGKSALLANWAFRFRQQHPGDFLLMHFIGASPYSADWAAMLRRIMGEFKRRFDIQQEIPAQPGALGPAFAKWLHIAAARGRVVLILDALNQLEDRDGAPDLVWLPPVIPANVRLILSTLPGRPLDDLKKRGWPTLQVGLLEPDERRQLIREYLAQYTKALSPDRVERIAAASQTANPLYLRALLEELRVFGIYERLDEWIERYLAATTTDDLYEKILERYEQDYERDRPGLVRDAMTLLWAARRGLSEAELLELLGSGGEPLPQAHWSPLYLASESSLVSRSGLIGFFHDYLRQAVREKYLPTEQEQPVAHLRLADYFEICEHAARKRDELPWQLARAKSWQRLYDLLPSLFEPDDSRWDVIGYWAEVESNSSLRMVDAYRHVIENPSHSDFLEASFLLVDAGHYMEALRMHEERLRSDREKGSLSGFCLEQYVRLLMLLGDLDSAVTHLNELESIRRQANNRHGLQHCLALQGAILCYRGDLEHAMPLFKEQEQICRELGIVDALQESLLNQAHILINWGKYDDAMILLKEQEWICRELGLEDSLQACLGNQGVILRLKGDLNGAMSRHKEQERLCRKLGDKEGLGQSLGQQGLVLEDCSDPEGALALHKEQEKICRELGSLYWLQFSLSNQARILMNRGDQDGALALYEEQEQICRQMGNKDDLARSLVNQASLLFEKRSDLHGALPKCEEAIRILTEGRILPELLIRAQTIRDQIKANL